MDTQKIAIAESCLNGAYDDTMDFPNIVGTLMDAGFDGYVVDYRCHTTTYFLPSAEHVVLENRPSNDAVASNFDQAGVAAQIKWAQSGAADYSYGAFCKNMKGFGCAGYIVSFLGRRVLYFGRTAETHVEHFPQ